MPEPNKRRTTNKRKRQATPQVASVRDTVKLLLFVQVVLICAAGAIPDPFKLLAFLPGAAVAGAGLFWTSAYAVASFRRARERHASAAVAPAAGPGTKKRVVRITKIA